MSVIALESLPEVRIGHLGPMLVSVWHAPATVSALQTMAAHQRSLFERYGFVGTLQIVARIPQPPAAEVSEAIKALDLEFRDKSIGSVVVVLQRGLSAIIVRSFLAAASLMSTSKMQVVKSLEEAAERVQALPRQHADVVSHTNLALALEAFAAPRS